MALIDKLKELLAPPAAGGAREAPDLRVATCALLMEVAESDMEFAPEERRLIIELLQGHFSLERGEVDALMQQTEATRRHTADLWPFTSVIARTYTPEEKRALLVLVWRVIFADGHLSPYEDHLAHRLERMLSVNHSVLMDAKQEARRLQSGSTS